MKATSSYYCLVIWLHKHKHNSDQLCLSFDKILFTLITNVMRISVLQESHDKTSTGVIPQVNQCTLINQIKYQVFKVAVVMVFKRASGRRGRFAVGMGMLDHYSVGKLMVVPVHGIVPEKCQCKNYRNLKILKLFII